MEKNHPHTNRLIKEKSPYLLQHAHNPVDWFPWGNEAFSIAKQQDKPIFLSIGYSTCHWCHVMEKESFEDEAIAKQMNETFLNIKIDREELPHIDSLYMEFAQSMMVGASGWPLNVILTPDLKPFFAATYLPPHNRHGLMGLSELVQRINEVWYSEERERVVAQADKVLEIFTESVHTKGSDLPEKEQLEDGMDLLFQMSDPMHGGLKGAPKFPIGYQANLQLHYYATRKDSRALFMVERTLDKMQQGGIYDHLGGGFSRYSVDELWLIPHFEKMLYDNALLIYSYLEAWQITKKNLYKEICEDIIRYILRDMTHPQGGFYSAEDADSEGHEGRFYTWRLEEIQNILGKEQSEAFCEYYNVVPEGNFEGRSILHLTLRLEEFALKKGVDPVDLAARFEMQRKILWKAREMREHPFKDDKILSSWNGLMIHSLVQAGCAFENKEYINAAAKAANFIEANLWKDGRLLRRWRDSEALYHAGLEEYAFLIRAYISLFEAGCGTPWLKRALQMSEILDDNFKIDDGAFYQTDYDENNLILRKTQFADGAEPSGNAIHCENLLRLYQLTTNVHFMEQAEDILRTVKKFIDNYPLGYCYSLLNINRYYDRHAPTLVVALNQKEEHFDKIRTAIYQNFIPHKCIIWKKEEDSQLSREIPYMKDQGPIEGKTTLYICHEGACLKPLNEISEILTAIQKL